MKCLSLNIWNFQRSWLERRQLIADLILTHYPDVVLLQETRHDFRHQRGRGQDRQLADLTGYHSTWLVGQVYLPWPRVDEGLTILTREIPQRVMYTRLKRFRRERGDGNQRICLGVALAAGAGEFHAYTTHFSLNERVRVRNAVEVDRFVAETSGATPAILTGDLNGVPSERAIRFLSGQERVDAHTGGFEDCWTLVNGGDPGYTWAPWDPIRRIDYIFGRNLPRPPSSVQLVGTEAVDGIYPSDHIGLLADIPLPTVS